MYLPRTQARARAERGRLAWTSDRTRYAVRYEARSARTYGTSYRKCSPASSNNGQLLSCMVADRGIPKRAPDTRYPKLVGRYPKLVGRLWWLEGHFASGSGAGLERVRSGSGVGPELVLDGSVAGP